MRNIYLQKSCWKWGQGNSPVSFCLFKKNFTKDKSKWLKLQVSRPETPSKRDSITGIFLWFHTIFSNPYSQNVSGWLLLLTLPTNEGVIVWSYFFCFFLHFFPFIIAGFPLSQGKSGNLLEGWGKSTKLEIFWKKSCKSQGRKFLSMQFFNLMKKSFARWNLFSWIVYYS